MSLSTWFYSALTGTDLQQLQDQGDSLDSQLANQNAQDYAPGGRLYNKIAASQGTQAANNAWKNVQNNLATGATGDVTQQVADAFSSGITDGANAERKGLSGFISKIFDTAFRIIPWQVWLAGGIFLFFYFGGHNHVKKLFTKK